MKQFRVEMPFCGYVSRLVEAENEEDAKEKFYDAVAEMGDVLKECDHYEWDFHESITRGNVFYGSLNQMDIIDEGEIDG